MIWFTAKVPSERWTTWGINPCRPGCSPKGASEGAHLLTGQRKPGRKLTSKAWSLLSSGRVLGNERGEQRKCAFIPRKFHQLRAKMFIDSCTFQRWYDTSGKIIYRTYGAVMLFWFRGEVSCVGSCECLCGKTAFVIIRFPWFLDWKALSHRLRVKESREVFNTFPFM